MGESRIAVLDNRRAILKTDARMLTEGGDKTKKMIGTTMTVSRDKTSWLNGSYDFVRD